ncbi:hypothetical protein ACFLQU_04690 [Verrucomicrobiota bacterium]
MLTRAIAALALLTVALCPAHAVEHPYMLWTPDEAARIRKTVETELWAKKAYEDLKTQKGRSEEMRLLFRYGVMGEADAGQQLKGRLMRLAHAPHPLGAAPEFEIIAYDLLHSTLSEGERNKVEKQFREYIVYSITPGSAYDTNLFNNAVNYARYDCEGGRYTRVNWLPNIIFPRKIAANLMALAVGDKKLIRDTWAAHGSIKWYFDKYLCDKGFYNEEFSKVYATLGEMFMFCIAARNFGMDELGFGYKGRKGATMRGHMQSLLDITYPRIDLGTARPRYQRLSLGDVRSHFPLQQNFVQGYLPGKFDGMPRWCGAGAWGGPLRGKQAQWDIGKTSKMSVPLWFELAHRSWPKDGYDYFLIQMRKHDEIFYEPSLFFGLDPIGPEEARPPPAPSGVYPERGLVMLRADESPTYWEGPAPAACLRLATPYAHSVNDAFALVDLYALNRPIYQTPKFHPGYAFGYDRSVRSHSSIMIDGHIKKKDWGRTGSVEPGFSTNVFVRHGFHRLVKFVAARTAGRYKGVDETRSLFLTPDYMLEMSDCVSTNRHHYLWILQAFGKAQPSGPDRWRPSDDLAACNPTVTDVRAFKTEGEPWSVTVMQAKQNPGNDPLAKYWFTEADPIGVRVHMLEQSDSVAYTSIAPKPTARDRQTRQTKPYEPFLDGATLQCGRWGTRARFVAIHEPFKVKPGLVTVRTIASTSNAVAVAVVGPKKSGVNDRIFLRIGDGYDGPLTLGDGKDTITFADHAFIRIGKREIFVYGGVRKVELAAPGWFGRRIVVNGKPGKATRHKGKLVYPPN